MTKILMFGAVGPYPKAFSRALAPYVDLLGCIVPRPLGAGFSQLLRHRLSKVDSTGFACPVWSLGAYGEEKSYERLAASRLVADLVVVAGFPHKLPARLVNGLAPHGALNAHPSLLPRDRGPSPTFWALRRGDTETGVTLHALTDALDAGDVLLRARMPVPFGGLGVPLLEKLGALGGELVGRNLPTLLAPWLLTPQGPDVGPWARKPKREDFELLPQQLTARQAFHFVRGARAFGTPWAVLADETYYFGDALACDEGRSMPGEFLVMGDTLMLRVRDGTVTLSLLN